LQRAILVPFLLVLPFVSPAWAQEIEYAFPPGEVLRYKFVRNEDCSYKAKGGKVKEVHYTEYTLELQGKPGSRCTDVTAVFRDLKNRVVTPERNFSFDSRKKYSTKAVEKNVLLGVFAAMQGDSFKISLDERGNLYSVDGFTRLIARASSRGLTGSRMLEDVFDRLLRKILSDEIFRAGFRLTFIPVPAGTKRGATWRKEISCTFAGITETFHIEYTLASISPSKAALSMGGKFVLSVDGEEIPKHGTISGSGAFDVKAKRLLFSKIQASIKLPNISLNSRAEFKFLKSLDPSEVGPESFEKPLGPLDKILERRVVEAPAEESACVFATERCEKLVFFTCHGDEVRVVSKRVGPDGNVLRIVTVLGREGWMLESDTRPKAE